MTTGITSPASALVTALNSLQKPMMLTPCWPSAGPTGGAGLAWPAGICNLMMPVTFFAINFYTDFTDFRELARSRLLRANPCNPCLCFFNLPVFQFHGRIPPKNVDRHLQLSAFGIDFLDHAAEVQERAVVDLDRFAHFKIDLRLFRLLRGGNLRLDGLDFLARSRHRRFSAHKPDH